MASMRVLLAVLLASAASAFAQAPPCADCGVVRSVRSITKEIRPSAAQEETKPSGLVASIPLKGGKAQVGSSSNIGKDAPTTVQTWEVVVRMEDGKFRVVVLDDSPGLVEGEKVRFYKGKLIRGHE
jgi:hypothetical protein